VAGIAEVAAVLGEGTDAEITLTVVQAIVVDVVNDEIVGGVCDLAVHFDAVAVFFSHGVVIFGSTFCKPDELAQSRVVFGIDDGELAACQGYETWGAAFSAGSP